MGTATEKPDVVALLIDGDVIAFIAAAAVQKNVQDEYGNVSGWADLAEGKAVAAGLIARYKETLEPGIKKTVTVILSDPHANWRYDVDHNYKSNRKELVKPMLLDFLKQYLRDEYDAIHLPRLEADDTLSLLATDPRLPAPGLKTIIVGRDKDFKSIPGYHHQYGHVDANGKPIVDYITLEEANRWHAIQSLSGDMTDGFPGCPGIGMLRAGRIIDECALLVPEKGWITRGINKGTETVKWSKVPAANVWECIVSNYEKVGLSEAEALTTARLAHLLRYGDYNEETHEVKLWTPH